MYRVGLSIRAEESLIKRVSTLRIPCVELFESPSLEGRITSISGALRTSGVVVSSLHAPSGISHDIGNPDPEKRGSAVLEHKKCLKHCASLGSSLHVIYPGFDNYLFKRGGRWDDEKKIVIFPRDEVDILRLWEANESSLAELADVAAGIDVKVALETAPPNIMTPKETFDVVRAVDRKNLGVCLDTAHVNVGGTFNPADVIREVGSLLWALHMHDNRGEGDFHLVPGRGNIDWNNVAEALRDVSYDGVNIELSPADWNSPQTWNDMAEGAAFLRSVFALN